MNQLRHRALQVRLIGKHGELRLVIDTVPDDNVLFAGRLRATDREEQPPIEGDLQKPQHLRASWIESFVFNIE